MNRLSWSCALTFNQFVAFFVNPFRSKNVRSIVSIYYKQETADALRGKDLAHMKGRDILIRLLLLGGTAYVLGARPALAIPVFARIYDKPCGTCHTVYSQLNPAGEDFRVHGLHGLTPVVKPLRVGSLFEVPGTLPLAISFGVGEDLSKVDTPSRSNPTPTHFNFEFLSLLAGGELGRHLAFLVDYAPVLTNPQTGEISINTRLG